VLGNYEPNERKLMKKEMATVFKQSLGLSVVYATCCYLYNKGYYMG
jgi:hypothetical protein